MEKKEYINLAVDMVVDFAAEQGMKYRRGDFEEMNVPAGFGRGSKNHIGFIGGKNAPTGIFVVLSYDFERCGSRLKGLRNRFLNYINARVRDFGVVFTFSFRELDFEDLKGNEEESSEKIEKIIAKVAKLLELGDLSKNPSEAEAIAASMKAQELLAKYNLDITAVTGEEKKEDVEQVVSDIGTGKKWKYGLAEVIARSYCCRVFYVGAEQVVFYGYKSDILIARRVFVYLFEVGNRLANAHVKERRENYDDTKGVYNSFCSGFVDGVDGELSRNCKALVLVVPQEVNESFTMFSEKFKTVDHSISTNDNEAYELGRIEGKRALNARYLEGGTDDDKQSYCDTGTC
jgi:hypothetical protein